MTIFIACVAILSAGSALLYQRAITRRRATCVATANR